MTSVFRRITGTHGPSKPDKYRRSLVSDLKKFNLIPATKLQQDNTLRDALKLIEDRNWMIIVIVDDQEQLCGIVSAGDLRKAILQGTSVNAPLSGIMNRNPVCININHLQDMKDVNQVFDHLKHRYGNVSVLNALIPVITEDKKISGLVSFDSLTTGLSVSDFKPYHKTVLVVGGAGYIGSVLTRILLQHGWHVRVLDKLLYTDDSLNGLDSKNFTLIKGDANNIDTLVNAVEDVEAVIYLAELVGDPACSVAPQTTLKTNYLAVTSIAHLCSHLNINRFIYTSSCSVYGASQNVNDFLTEESPLEPLSLYARMKAQVEEAILLVCNQNQLFAPTLLRLGTVFGYSYRPRFDLVVNTFVKNAWQKGAIEVFGGDQWRPNVHVSDVGRSILTVLEAPVEDVRKQIFNVGSNQLNYTINGLADITKEVFPDLTVMKKDHAVDKRNYKVDFSKIEKVLGFKAKVGIREGMLELKNALENKRFSSLDLEASQFSNIKRLKELNLT